MKLSNVFAMTVLLLAVTPALGQIKWIRLVHAPYVKNAQQDVAPQLSASRPVPVQHTAPPSSMPVPQQTILEQASIPATATTPEVKPKQQQEKFATCAEATDKVQGYTMVKEALQNCPDLLAMQQDPNTAKTFFVPSDKAIKSLASSSHIPVHMLSSPAVKGLMCNVLKYHIVDGVHLKRDMAVNQKLTTLYNGAEITVTAVGEQPQLTTSTGVQANIKRVVFCGNSIVFGVDTVLTPFKLPKLGH